jgi:hypothetical protein
VSTWDVREAWDRACGRCTREHDDDPIPCDGCGRAALEAAYLAGAEQMRERAAAWCVSQAEPEERAASAGGDATLAEHAAARARRFREAEAAIRALPLESEGER